MKFHRSLIALFIAVGVASAVFAQTSRSGRVMTPAPNASGWHSGTLVNTADFDCLQLGGGFSYDYIIGTYLSYYGDPNASPQIPRAGDIYYTDLVVSNVAACQSASVQPWLILPGNTSLAISASNPVYCFRNGVQVACSQNPQFGVSLSGAYGYNLGVWADLKGGNIEIQVPVSSSSAGPITLYSRVDTADGWSNPFATPSVSLIIGTNSSAPTVSYPVPSTTMITDTTARNLANVTTSVPGTIYFDIGTSTNYDTTSAGFSTAAGSFQFYNDWGGMNPGTLYHWRARFTYGAGSTALGADQTFTTTGTVAIPAIPTGVLATAVTPTQVTVTWPAVVGATSYSDYRRSAGSTTYALLGPATATTYADTTVTGDHAYLYRVRALNAAGSSADSRADLATTVIFSDDRLVEFVTPIKAAHLTQLRTAISAIAALATNGGTASFTDVAAPGLIVKAVHILELRTQFDSAMGAIYGTNSSWATTPVQGGPITFVDFQQLRDRIK